MNISQAKISWHSRIIIYDLAILHQSTTTSKNVHMDVPQKGEESLWEPDGSGEEILGQQTEQEFYFQACRLPLRDKPFVTKHLNFFWCKNKSGELDKFWSHFFITHFKIFRISESRRVSWRQFICEGFKCNCIFSLRGEEHLQSTKQRIMQLSIFSMKFSTFFQLAKLPYIIRIYDVYICISCMYSK